MYNYSLKDNKSTSRFTYIVWIGIAVLAGIVMVAFLYLGAQATEERITLRAQEKDIVSISTSEQSPRVLPTVTVTEEITVVPQDDDAGALPPREIESQSDQVPFITNQLPITNVPEPQTPTVSPLVYEPPPPVQCPRGFAQPNMQLFNVNRYNTLGNYLPENLVNLNGYVETMGKTICLDQEAAEHAKRMLSDALEHDLHIAVISGYRNPQLQQFLYDNSLAKNGGVDVRTVAPSRHSEHQLGTTIDLAQYKNGSSTFGYAFGHTPEGQWIKNNAHKYGFVMSYPYGKTDITGYIHEPWHFRYVGAEHAEHVATLSSTTLGEYLRDLTGSVAG